MFPSPPIYDFRPVRLFAGPVYLPVTSAAASPFLIRGPLSEYISLISVVVFVMIPRGTMSSSLALCHLPLKSGPSEICGPFALVRGIVVFH